MIRLLILFLIITSLILFLAYGIRKLFRQFLSNINIKKKNFRDYSDKKKSRIIYDRNNIVVMKGDAPEKNNPNDTELHN